MITIKASGNQRPEKHHFRPMRAWFSPTFANKGRRKELFRSPQGKILSPPAVEKLDAEATSSLQEDASASSTPKEIVHVSGKSAKQFLERKRRGWANGFRRMGV